jgi:nitroreductase
MKLIEGLNWRYATKKYDNTKKVSGKDLDQLKEAVRLSASSFGLQLYKVLVIEDPAIKEKLLPATYGQTQVIDSSQVFVFCNYTKVDESDIDSYTDLVAKTRGLSKEDVKPYGDYMKGATSGFTQDQKEVWTAKQTYIALGNLLAAAGELKIDATPMEGFDANLYNEILGLTAKNLNAAVIATVGYRSEEDATKDFAKVRKSKENLFETI